MARRNPFAELRAEDVDLIEWRLELQAWALSETAEVTPDHDETPDHVALRWLLEWLPVAGRLHADGTTDDPHEALRLAGREYRRQVAAQLGL